MRLEKGWLDKANRCPSPNYDVRSSEEIDLIVIHSISLPPGIFGNSFVEDFFQNKLDHSKDKYFKEIKDLKVSSHFLIKRDGEITQFVSILDRAWHAGVSSFEGREDCNNYIPSAKEWLDNMHKKKLPLWMIKTMKIND